MYKKTLYFCVHLDFFFMCVVMQPFGYILRWCDVNSQVPDLRLTLRLLPPSPSEIILWLMDDFFPLFLPLLMLTHHNRQSDELENHYSF